VHWAPGIPRALCFSKGGKFLASLGRNGVAGARTFVDVIPGRECNERTRNLEIPGSMLRIAPE
jgi:hypothetical protein